MQNKEIIYYNSKTNSYIEFCLGVEENKRIKKILSMNTANDVKEQCIDVVIEYLSKIGLLKDGIDFPNEFLEVISDNELDMILMMSHSNDFQETVKNSIYIPLENKEIERFIEIDTGDNLDSFAVGLDSTILIKETQNSLLTAAVKNKKLEELFIRHAL